MRYTISVKGKKTEIVKPAAWLRKRAAEVSEGFIDFEDVGEVTLKEHKGWTSLVIYNTRKHFVTGVVL